VKTKENVQFFFVRLSSCNLFLLPSELLTVAFSWLYSLPPLERFLINEVEAAKHQQSLLLFSRIVLNAIFSLLFNLG
jgi:hypothetical protein